MKTYLFPGSRKKRHDEFFIRSEGNLYWLGHQHGETGDTHEVRISQDTYKAFIVESARKAEQYFKILNK
jgi:hypothetical protein